MNFLTPVTITAILLGYFLMLIGISYITTKNVQENSFYTGDKSSPWYVVSFGMIGASLSGITFLALPGKVIGDSFHYMQAVFGYAVGYVIVAYVLLPIYYKSNVVSIYEILGNRFGVLTRKSGAGFFLLSRVVGASLRLYLVAIVLDKCIFQPVFSSSNEAGGYSFLLSVVVTIVLIWIYTFRGGIKTVVWTDVVQTLFMLLSLVVTIYAVGSSITELSGNHWTTVLLQSNYSTIFEWEGDSNFWTMFFTGIFITVVMTGLDQDMMQKNLTVKTLKDSQKNMMWLSLSIVVINFFFLVMGGLLAEYSLLKSVDLPTKTELIFPTLALEHLPVYLVGIPFVLGTVAAAYSSADSALTSLTTSFSKDFLETSNRNVSERTRRFIHIGFSLVLFVGIIAANELIKKDDVIWSLFKMAGLTYGPLLGIFILAIFTKINLKEKVVAYVLVMSFVVSLLLFLYSEVWFGVKLGFSISLISTLMTLVGCVVLAKENQPLRP